jgi:hypothetical protein
MDMDVYTKSLADVADRDEISKCIHTSVLERYLRTHYGEEPLNLQEFVLSFSSHEISPYKGVFSLHRRCTSSSFNEYKLSSAFSTVLTRAQDTSFPKIAQS